MIVQIPVKVMQVRNCQRELLAYNKKNGFKFNYQFIGNEVVSNVTTETNSLHVLNIANIVRNYGLID